MDSSEERAKFRETSAQYAEVFDMGQALSSVGGDEQFLHELAGIIRAAWPTLLADIRQGLERRDLGAVAAKAHLAQVGAQSLSARRTYQSALQLEAAARKGDLPAAQSGFVNLEHEVKLLCFFLNALEDTE